MIRSSARNMWCSFPKARRRSWPHSKREFWPTPARSIWSRTSLKFWRNFQISDRPKDSSASWCQEIFSTFLRAAGTSSSRCRQVFQSVFGSNEVVLRCRCDFNFSSNITYNFNCLFWRYSTYFRFLHKSRSSY